MALDTPKASRELQAAGFVEAQADAIIAIVAGGESLTRIDLERLDENLRAEMRLLRSELRGEMQALRMQGVVAIGTATGLIIAAVALTNALG